MIGYITGKIIDKGKDHILVETQSGMGYIVYIPPAKVAEAQLQNSISLYTYHRVSENAQDLFGFESKQSKQFFELLLTVSGIGPKSAMNVFALGSIEEIQNAIARGDVKYLTAVQGMGKKTAERLVVELKNKVGSIESIEAPESGSPSSEAIDALLSMGYSSNEARDAVKQAEGNSTEEILKQALKMLSS